MNILDKILATKRMEVSESSLQRSFEDIFAEAAAVDRKTNSFSEALNLSDNKIIAEFKRRSPSKGFFNAGADAAKVVRGYFSAGAAAVSVLTDGEYFGGSIADLVEARKVAEIPVLRKDFIIDPRQICEARIAGADVILLIAAAMPDTASCERLAQFARSLELEVLLEIHGENELEYINPYVNVVGVNNRNLTTFVTDVEISFKLAEQIPAGFVKISESGISAPETVKELRRAGYGGFLMGENFMKESDPADSLAKFLNALNQ